MFRNLYCGTYLSGTKSAGPICRVQNRTGKCPYNASDGRPSPLMKYYTGRVKRVAPLKRPALLGCFDRRRPIYILIIYTTCIRQWHAYDRHYTFISHAHITNRKPTNLDIVVKIRYKLTLLRHEPRLPAMPCLQNIPVSMCIYFAWRGGWRFCKAGPSLEKQTETVSCVVIHLCARCGWQR